MEVFGFSCDLVRNSVKKFIKAIARIRFMTAEFFSLLVRSGHPLLVVSKLLLDSFDSFAGLKL